MFPNTIKLHSIIQTMTPNEKRYFTRQCELTKADSNLLVLFKALNGLKKYDEKKVLEYLHENGSEKLVENLSTETIRAIKVLLNMVTSLADKKSKETKLENAFRQIKYLYEKNIFDQAYQKLKKLEKEAIEHEQKELLLKIYKFERDIKRNANLHKDFESLKEIDNKETALLESMLLEQKLRSIFGRLSFLVQNRNSLDKNQGKTQLAQIETALKAIDQNQCHYFVTKMFYVHSKIKIYDLKSDKKAVFKCMDEIEHIYKTHKNANKTSSFKQIKFLVIYLSYLLKYNMSPDQFWGKLTEIKSIKVNSPRDEMNKFQNVYHLEFIYFLKQGDFEKMSKLIPALQKGLKKYDTQIALDIRMTIWYNLMIYYFIIEDFHSAQYWIQEKILEYGKKSNCKDLYHIAKLFDLLIHYELDNAGLLKSWVAKVKRSFDLKDNSNELIKLVTKLMTTRYTKYTNVMNTYYGRTGELEKKDFEQVLQKFNKLDPSKHKNLPWDEIKIWLTSKVQELPMQQIAEGFLQNSNHQDTKKTE